MATLGAAFVGTVAALATSAAALAAAFAAFAAVEQHLFHASAEGPARPANQAFPARLEPHDVPFVDGTPRINRSLLWMEHGVFHGG